MMQAIVPELLHNPQHLPALYDDCKPKKFTLLVFKGLYASYGLSETNTIGYYHTWRTHRSLAMDAPEPRVIQPPEMGPVRKLPEISGLHHHYEPDSGVKFPPRTHLKR
jgi:hypothetical protein